MAIEVQSVDRTIETLDAGALAAMLSGPTPSWRTEVAERILDILEGASITTISQVALDEILNALRASGPRIAAPRLRAIVLDAHRHHPPLPPLPPPATDEGPPGVEERPPTGEERPPAGGESPTAGEPALCFWGMCRPARCEHAERQACQCALTRWAGSDPTSIALDDAMRALERLQRDFQLPGQAAEEAARALEQKARAIEGDLPVGLRDLLLRLAQDGATPEETKAAIQEHLDSAGIDGATRAKIAKELPELSRLHREAQDKAAATRQLFDAAVAIDLASIRDSLRMDDYPPPKDTDCTCEWQKYIHLIQLRGRIALLETQIAHAEADMPSFWWQLYDYVMLVLGNVVGALASLASTGFSFGVFSWEIVDFFLDVIQGTTAAISLAASIIKARGLTRQVIDGKLELAGLLLDWHRLRNTPTSHGLR